MSATTLTSELEAINTMLEACDESPVASLSHSGLYPLDRAKGILSETSRVVQSLGWKFNTEHQFPLPRDGQGQIALPPNALKVDVDEDGYSITVQRGLRLYDAKAHSYTFERDQKGTVTFLLSWDELPQPARHYILIRAARTMQGRTPVSDSTYAISEADEQAALLALSDHESDVGDHNMLRDSWSVASILMHH